jgi:hypothetical protein
MGPTRELVPRLREARSVRDERVKGREPAKRLVEREKKVIFDSPPISEGREPVKDFETKESEITSPAPEQVRPVHTGDVHLLATLAQFQSVS